MERHPKAFSEQEADNTEESCKRSKQNSLMGSERWKDLDTNVLMEIFSQIPIDDVILNTCLVCHSWRQVSWQYLFWSHNVLNLRFFVAASNSNNYFHSNPEFPGKYNSTHQYDQMAGKLTKKLRQIMEGADAYGHSLEDWRRSIHTIIIPYDLQLSDEHLLYIAERTPGVKHLSLLGTHKITAEGFGKVIQNWKFPRSIHLGVIKDDNWSSQIIKEIGRNCKEVEALYIHEDQVIDNTNPLIFDIFNNLPGSKVLGFEAAMPKITWIIGDLTMFHQLQEIHCHGRVVAPEIGHWNWCWCLRRTDGEKRRWKQMEC